MRSLHWKEVVAWAAAIVLVLIGASILLAILFSPVETASFGWFAYAPLSASTFVPDNAVLVPRTAIAGAVALTLGLTAAGVLTGWRLGKRAARPDASGGGSSPTSH